METYTSISSCISFTIRILCIQIIKEVYILRLEKNEKLLIFGRWTSKIGDSIFDYVNSIIIVTKFSKSSLILALYQSSQTIVNIMFNLIGGAIADSGNKKKIIIIADLLSSIVCFTISFFINSSFVATILIIANAILALIFSFSSPTFKSIVREMVKKDRISLYNSVSNIGKEIIYLIGPVIGLFLIDTVGARGALLINALTFLFSAISECCLVKINTEKKQKSKTKNILRDIKEGIRYLIENKNIFYLLILSALVNLFLSGYNLLLPYTNVIYGDIFSGFYAKSMVFQAIGALIGSFLNTKISTKLTGSIKVLIIFLGLVGCSIGIVPLITFTKNIVICLTPFLFFGLTLTIYNINFMSYVQINVDEEYLGRVFSVIFTVSVLFMPIGSILFSLLNITSSIGGFGLIGLGVLVLSLVAMIFIKVENKC